MKKSTPFLISLAEISRGGEEAFHYHCMVPAPADIRVDLIGIPVATPVEIDLYLQLIAEGVLVQGEVSAGAEGSCARCAEPLKQELQEKISEVVFFPAEMARLVAEGDEEAKDFPVICEDRVDLEPLVRDALGLALPLQPLCQIDCLGLCPECGEKWENLPVEHKHETLDPRFAVLDELAARLHAEENIEDR